MLASVTVSDAVCALWLMMRGGKPVLSLWNLSWMFSIHDSKTYWVKNLSVRINSLFDDQPLGGKVWEEPKGLWLGCSVLWYQVSVACVVILASEFTYLGMLQKFKMAALCGLILYGPTMV